MDVTLVAAKDYSEWIAHEPGCVEVALARAQGRPLMTLLECEGVLPPLVKTHDCLNEDLKLVTEQSAPERPGPPYDAAYEQNKRRR